MKDTSALTLLDEEQAAFIESVKQEIRTAQHRALRQVNHDMILLYWEIGKMLNAHVAYGNKFIERLARELRSSFPGLKGIFCSQSAVYAEICTRNCRRTNSANSVCRIIMES